MAKLTITALQTFITTYILAAKQAGTYSPTVTSIDNMVDKIGRQVMLDGDFQDKLPELEGQDLPLGKTIEEYFIDLVLPTIKDPTGANTMAPSAPTFESAAYSYPFTPMTAKTTVHENMYEISASDTEVVTNIVAKIIERLENSKSLTRYFEKKQLLANLIAKVEAATNATSMINTMAKPVDTATGEAFIKQVKADVETASFANEGANLANTLIGAAPRMTLFVLKGVMPSIEVDTQAGAFNLDKIGIPANVKVVDSFGDNATNVYAILCDPRGVKLHPTYRRTRRQENADGDFDNYVKHWQDTGFISKYTFVKVFKPASA